MSNIDKIKAKVEKQHEAFYNTVIGMGIDEIKKNILLYTKHIQEINKQLKNNKEILEAEHSLKIAKKPYNDKIKEAKDKIKQLKGFVDDSICVQDLENQMIKYAMEQEEQKLKMENCPAVQIAKESLDMIKGPLTEGRGILQLKVSYLNILISEKQGFQPGYRDE
jgi:hypothetical protein